MKKGIWVVGIVLVAAVAALALNGPTTGNVVSAGEMRIPVSEITGQAKWYDYKGIGFFAVEALDGSIKTAFDECDVCYRSGKGFRQEGNYMVCNNCGNRYPISGLGAENKNPGGCWPGFLPSKVEGGELVILHSDLEEGRWRF